MNKKALWTVIAAIIVIGGAIGVYALMQQKNAGAPSSRVMSDSNKVAAATITYSDSGFSPNKTTVKSGDAVAIKNTSSHAMQLDSNPHPVHTDDTELNIGTVSPGQTITFTVTKKGTFGFHNHLNPSDTGTIVIQ